MVELGDLLDRRPRELSGGQRQRVALARAIVRQPAVFLMDEPLSNLDAKLRVSTRAQLKNLHHELKVTTIYVTHDQIEAMTLADRVVVMNKGDFQQVGTPTEIYDTPANTFVAGLHRIARHEPARRATSPAASSAAEQRRSAECPRTSPARSRLASAPKTRRSPIVEGPDRGSRLQRGTSGRRDHGDGARGRRALRRQGAQGFPGRDRKPRGLHSQAGSLPPLRQATGRRIASGVTDMTPQEMEARIVRYGDLKPCKTAFIDAHTPGSDQKENFTIIGGGVSEAADQHVHIAETPGFNIGAAGQPPECRNSLHSHRTAEVFFVLKGSWRFFWGRWGKAGEVVLEEGDIFNIPTGIFRAFENIGTDYGMIMAILGGDDAGGGVIWAPQVIEAAKDHGLVLGKNGRLYDTKKGQRLPDGVPPCRCSPKQSWRPFPKLQRRTWCPIMWRATGI